ncbi:hypothetical protein NQZ68_020289 [Dissostichus eleginoides]|nr:hypothetical protein NQZ68_020289 [Dissostichus eleginoides]
MEKERESAATVKGRRGTREEKRIEKEADAELKAGGEAGSGQHCQATRIGEKPMKKTSSKQKKLELQRCAVCLGDNMGQRRPSTSCAHNWKFLKKKKTASWIQRSMEGETITFLIKAKLDV